MSKAKRVFVLLALVVLALSSCLSDETDGTPRESAAVPAIPEKLEIGGDGVPVLRVYDVAAEEIEEMNLEDYVMGVVAGEMKNDWPMEALKAQAILARTFVLNFCGTKASMYEGADISTDVSEAQAYAPENINDRVRQAVEETAGMVLSADGEYPYAWFFAHSGGMTELPSVALDYEDEDPQYLSVVESPDSEDAPDDVKQWTVRFTEEEVLAAAAETGLELRRHRERRGRRAGRVRPGKDAAHQWNCNIRPFFPHSDRRKPAEEHADRQNRSGRGGKRHL